MIGGPTPTRRYHGWRRAAKMFENWGLLIPANGYSRVLCASFSAILFDIRFPELGALFTYVLCCTYFRLKRKKCQECLP